MIDRDYRGEVKVLLFNMGEEDFVVNPGERIAQLILEKALVVEPTEVQDLSFTSRGESGFGSTGNAHLNDAQPENEGGEKTSMTFKMHHLRVENQTVLSMTVLGAAS